MSANAEPAPTVTIGARLGSVLRVVAFYAFSALCLPIVILVAVVLPGSAYYPVARWWATSGLRIFGVRVVGRGMERLERGCDYVILANHRSHLDPLAIVSAFDRHQTRWVAKRELLKVPLFGLTLRATGQIVIDRSDHEQAIRALRDNLGRGGASVVFFPEGHRADDATLLPFKKGGAAFAIDAGLPVVPVAISGSERRLRAHSMLVLPGTIHVLVGEPIDVSSLSPGDRGALTARARGAIEGLLAEVETRPLEPAEAAANV